jgi:hypothetical protein
MDAPSQSKLRQKIDSFLREEALASSGGTLRLLEELEAHPDRLVLDIVLSCWMTSRETMGLLQWLVAEGCNPLDPSQATLSSHMHDERNTVSLAFMLRRMEQEDGQALRSPQGENLLHLLCQARPEWLGTSLVNYVDNIGHDSGRYLPIWFNEHRTIDGSTPLHVWWKGTARVLKNNIEGPKSPFFEWDVSEALIRGGARVEALDGAGVSCARQMLDAAQLGSPMPMQAAGVIQAMTVIEHEDLDAATPPGRKSGSSLRL